MRAVRPLAISMILTALAACAEKPREPLFASSAASPTYATRFPGELATVRTAYFDQEKVVAAGTTAFQSYPGEFEEPDWNVVRAVTQQADHEGRSETYATRFESIGAIRRFYDAEKDEIRRKVAGAVQYTAKKKHCEGDVGSSAGVALDKALDERLSERLHASSDAHAIIAENEDTLGQKNVSALEKQADTIGLTSYIAHVGVVRIKLRLRQMLTETEDVQATLDRTVMDLQTLEARDDLKEDAHKHVAERLIEVKNARRRVDAEIAGAQSLSDEIEERIEALQEKYRRAQASLVEKIDQRAADAGGPRGESR